MQISEVIPAIGAPQRHQVQPLG